MGNGEGRGIARRTEGKREKEREREEGVRRDFLCDRAPQQMWKV